jgi:Holliday junction DNA helicase RuvA
MAATNAKSVYNPHENSYGVTQPPMIASVRGTLIASGIDFVVVETGGIGYHVLVPNSVLQTLGAPGSEVLLYTHLHVREDALTLYGFEVPDQRAFFETLISVTGIGPRMALGLLSAVPLDQLQHAIASENMSLLARVPGIGKKTAARLVLELKGKLDLSKVAPSVAAATPATTALNSELQDILTSLGYSVLEAQSAVASLPADAPADLEERLRLALRYFGGV